MLESECHSIPGSLDLRGASTAHSYHFDFNWIIYLNLGQILTSLSFISERWVVIYLYMRITLANVSEIEMGVAMSLERTIYLPEFDLPSILFPLSFWIWKYVLTEMSLSHVQKHKVESQLPWRSSYTGSGLCVGKQYTAVIFQCIMAWPKLADTCITFSYWGQREDE